MNQCKCGNKDNYNYALDIGLCNSCIAIRLEEPEAENKKLRESLEDMVRQFAHWSDGGHRTGGLSALEGAFEALGWDDPHIDETCQCNEPGCKKQICCGWPDGDNYRNTCSEHCKL